MEHSNIIYVSWRKMCKPGFFTNDLQFVTFACNRVIANKASKEVQTLKKYTYMIYVLFILYFNNGTVWKYHNFKTFQALKIIPILGMKFVNTMTWPSKIRIKATSTKMFKWFPICQTKLDTTVYRFYFIASTFRSLILCSTV